MIPPVEVLIDPSELVYPRRHAGASLVNEDALPPEEWTAGWQTKANLAAMLVARGAFVGADHPAT